MSSTQVYHIERPGTGTNRLEPIYVESTGYDKNHFLLPPHYHSDIARVLVPYGTIRDRIERLAWDIKTHYGTEEVHVLCILKGSRFFFTDLINFLSKIHIYRNDALNKNPPFFEHYIRLKSYVNTESTGNLQVISDDLSVLRGKHVLVVEDIIDTGNTLYKFFDHLLALGPKSIKIAALTEKRTSKNIHNVRGDFVGFSIPDEFIVGFGMDYNEYFRDLSHLCIMDTSAIPKYAQ